MRPLGTLGFKPRSAECKADTLTYVPSPALSVFLSIRQPFSSTEGYPEQPHLPALSASEAFYSFAGPESQSLR